MNKIENYLGIANHDIQVANNSDELKSYVASILCEIDELQQENKQLKYNWNKLREYVGVEWYSYDNDSVECEVAKDILNKMEELKGSNSNDSN